MNDPTELTNSLGTRLAQAQELHVSLNKSLAIQSLWPDVFDGGPASSVWLGKAPQRGIAPEPLHTHHTFRITNRAGEMREYTFNQVPALLGGGKS